MSASPKLLMINENHNSVLYIKERIIETETNFINFQEEYKKIKNIKISLKDIRQINIISKDIKELVKNDSNLLLKLLEKTLFKKYPECKKTFFKTYTRENLLIQLQFCLFRYGKTYSEVDYIFIDEGQDVTGLEYNLIQSILKNNLVINIYGDVMQLLDSKRGIVAWNILDQGSKFDYFTLNQNYRNTRQITEFTNQSFNLEIAAIGLNGEDVKKIELSNIQEVINFHSQKNNKDRIAIIVDSIKHKQVKDLIGSLRKTIEIIFNDIEVGKVSIVEIEMVKGLEFEVVIVIEKGINENGRYISYTRTLSDLYIIEESRI